MSGAALLLGGTGRLGRALAAVLRERGVPFAAPGRSEVDLAATDRLAEIIGRIAPGVVLNAAAFTDVAGCEAPEIRDAVFRINAGAPEALARACDRLAIPLVHVSTDYVFDGDGRVPYRETDDPHPIQVYGASKLAGEQAVLAAASSSLVVRVSTVFGPWVPERPAYPDAILRQARTSARIEVAARPVASPTFTIDAAEAIVDLWRAGASGVVHVVNDGACSRLELARAVVEEAGFAPPVVVDERNDPPGALRRPAYSVLDTARLETILGRRLRPWRDALRCYLEMIGAKAPSSGPP